MREGPFLDKARNSASLFMTLSAALLIAFFAARIMEFVCIAATATFPHDLGRVVLQALLFDAAFFLRSLPILFIPFFLACFVARSTRSRSRVYAVGGSVFLILYAALIKYFVTALVPLGADLFGYSLKDIGQTIRAGVSIDLLSLLLFFVPLALFWGVLAFVSSRWTVRPAYAFVVLGAGAALNFAIPVMPASTIFETEASYSLAVNKMAFFGRDTVVYMTHRTSGMVHAVPLRKEGRQPQDAALATYDKETYPFLRIDDTPDVLGRFFRIDPKRPPNMVLILVEGLGKAFSGPNAYLGSFTPFLDELAGKSLYWENFLACQGRTFAALPSILGSLPYADKGFNDLGKRMPRHHTLMSIVKHNGYRIKFYFGSDLDFDNERAFLQKQGADVLVGIDDYDASYARSPGTSWGYPDRELMRKSLEMDRRDSQQPFLTFIQTMSMHTSYSIPDQERYLRLFEERMNTLGFDEARKERHRQYKKIYSTVLYADDALRFFFEEYAKLPAYGNTLFLITGDHRLPEIPLSTKIDRFHVPLLIFSPMLKRPAHIQSISSQLDIAPSLVAFLRKNYHLDTPSAATWVGTGLDTDPSFRNIHSYPLKHTINNLIDYISGMYFLNEDTLFSIGKYMDLEPIKDEKKRKELVAEFDQYKAKNDRFARDLKLIPDDLYERDRPVAVRQSGR
jgi:phosphoglycerol transferase MdoB-like AlkP superfamily enzyme